MNKSSHLKNKFLYTSICTLLLMFLSACNLLEKSESLPSNTGVEIKVGDEANEKISSILSLLPEEYQQDEVYFLDQDGVVWSNQGTVDEDLALLLPVNTDEFIFETAIPTTLSNSDTATTNPKTLSSQSNSTNTIKLPLSNSRNKGKELSSQAGTRIVDSTFRDNTGVRFAAFTKTGESIGRQFKYMSARFTLPALSNIKLDTQPICGTLDANPNIRNSGNLSETPYIMFGGFGSRGAESALDAGLQFNCDHGNWALFFLRENRNTAPSPYVEVSGFNYRIPSGSVMDLEFFLIDGRGNLPGGGSVTDENANTPNESCLQDGRANGSDVLGFLRAQVGSRTVTLATCNRLDGWFLDGRSDDHLLKVEVAIAQAFDTGGDTSNYNSGAQFSGLRIDNVQVADCISCSKTTWNIFNSNDPLTGRVYDTGEYSPILEPNDPNKIQASDSNNTVSIYLSCPSSSSLSTEQTCNGTGLSASGSWTSSGGRSSTHSGNPRYSFEVTSSGNVTIDLTSSVDTYLYLLNSSGSVIESDDDDGSGYDSRISRYLSSGTYYVVAATYSSGRSGSFNLSVQGSVSNLRKISTRTQSVSGSWTSSGGRNPLRSGNKFITLKINTSGERTIDLTSPTVDTYLYILDSSFYVVAEDDDGGSGRNSRIIRHLPSGDYYLIAATYYTGQSGSFTLSITREVSSSSLSTTYEQDDVLTEITTLEKP